MNIKQLRSFLFIALLLSGAYYYCETSAPADDKYFGYYENVHGLQKSAPIYFYGVLIGRVYDVNIERNGIVRVIFSIHKNAKIPEGTIARITSDPLKGGMAIILKPGIGMQMKSNTTFITAVDSSLTDQFHTKFSPVIKTGREKLKDIDTALYHVISITDTNCKGSVQHKILETDEKIRRFSKTAKQTTEHIHQTFSKIDKISEGVQDLEVSSNKFVAKQNSSKKTELSFNNSVITSSKQTLTSTRERVKKINQSNLTNSPNLYKQTSLKIDSLYKSLEKMKR